MPDKKPHRTKKTKIQLATAAGISNQWLHAILSGKGRASIDTAEKLAQETDSNPIPWAKGDFAGLAAIMEKYIDEGEEET